MAAACQLFVLLWAGELGRYLSLDVRCDRPREVPHLVFFPGLADSHRHRWVTPVFFLGFPVDAPLDLQSVPTVATGKVRGPMCSYNSVNGVASCSNDFFNNQIMRKEWGLDGESESTRFLVAVHRVN